MRPVRDQALNVRILTRGPLARQDFDLYGKFGDRLLFGMSLPTLDNDLARIDELHAPVPINIRAENVRRIAAHAKTTGKKVRRSQC